MSNQPKWKFEANLEDVSPIDRGGYFVFTDETGVYAPEAELLQAPEDDEGTWTVYRFILEPCTFINGILSDNKYHPELRAWFADDIGANSNCVGIPLAQLIDMLVNGNVVNRALAWQAIGDYHGFENLDSYPLTLTREEAIQRYSDLPIRTPVA